MTNVYAVESVTEFIQEMNVKGFVSEIKVGKVEELYFNDMEGYNYNASINIITPDGYRNRRLIMSLNSTYLQDWNPEGEEMTVKDIIQEYFYNMVV